MNDIQELFDIADKLEALSKDQTVSNFQPDLQKILDACDEIGKSASGSWLGYHANVYYSNFAPPPPGDHFSTEWGLMDIFGDFGSEGDWHQVPTEVVIEHIYSLCGNPELKTPEDAAKVLISEYDRLASEAQSILSTAIKEHSDDKFLQEILDTISIAKPERPNQILQTLKPKGQIITRDMNALEKGRCPPPHLQVKARALALNFSVQTPKFTSTEVRKAASHLQRIEQSRKRNTRIGTNVFIGHGRSPLWRELKDFVQDRLSLPADEFNRVPVAGITNQTRLNEMLEAAALAVLIMTGEDESSEGELHARMNVVHEVGLFQGRLGFTKAIVVLEEGCEPFSNIEGLGQIRFPKGNIKACFEEIRAVAEREGLISGLNGSGS